MKISKQSAPRIGLVGASGIRVLGKTWRYTITGVSREDLGHRVVYAFRHGDMLIGAHHYRQRGVAVMVSEHRDGELITQVCERLGFQCVRGSTTRGGARALREFVREWPDVEWAITPDGPRGPRGSVAPGLVQLAALSGRPVVPIGIVASPAKRVDSWDRFAIPSPFARVGVHLGEPLEIPRRLGEDLLEKWVTRCRHAIDEAYRNAAESIGLDRFSEDVPVTTGMDVGLARSAAEG